MANKAPKKPKAPKGGLKKASLKSLEAYENRINDWATKMKERDKLGAKREQLIKKVASLANKHFK